MTEELIRQVRWSSLQILHKRCSCNETLVGGSPLPDSFLLRAGKAIHKTTTVTGFSNTSVCNLRKQLSANYSPHPNKQPWLLSTRSMDLGILVWQLGLKCSCKIRNQQIFRHGLYVIPCNSGLYVEVCRER